MRQGLILPNPALLKYAPPALEAPVTAVVPANDNFFGKNFAGADGIVDLPDAAVRPRGIEASKARRLVCIGGEIHPDPEEDEKTLVRVSGAEEVAFLEGLRLKAEGRELDAINAGGNVEHAPTIVLQNILATGLIGSLAGYHSDFYQPQNPINKLLIDKFTGKGNYQGIFIRPQFPIGEVRISRVNLEHEGGGAGYLLWFTNGEEPSPHPIHIEEDVWVEERPGVKAQGSVWPPNGTEWEGEHIGAVEHEDLTSGHTYVEFDDPNIHGKVWIGKRPGGDIVTEDDCGLGYVALGYR